VSLLSFANGRRPAMTPLERRSRWGRLQSGGAIITCLVIGLLSLHVSADKKLPFDLHQNPCTHWPDQDWDAECQCSNLNDCGRTADALYYNGGSGSNMRNVAYNRPAVSLVVTMRNRSFQDYSSRNLLDNYESRPK
jgi:hypothetical protein